MAINDKRKARIGDLAWRTGLVGIGAVGVENLAARWLQWLPRVPTDVHIDLTAVALCLVMWGAFARFRAETIRPVVESFQRGYRVGYDHGQAERDSDDLAEVLIMPAARYAAVPMQGPRHRAGRSVRPARKPAPRRLG